MNMPEAAELIRSAKYRDWWFKVEEHPINLEVTIGFLAEDSDEAFNGSRQPSRRQVSMTFSIHERQLDPLTPERVGDYVFSQIKGMVLHEAGEWFVWQKQRPYYPHARSIGGAVTFP